MSVNNLFSGFLSQMKKSFLMMAEEESGLTAGEIIKGLGWSEPRYYQQRKREGFPSQNFKPLRKALKLSSDRFLTLIKRYFEL